jgi:hypothetical protein
MYRELLIGCGHDKRKHVYPTNEIDWKNLTTVDSNEDCESDFCFDLNTEYCWDTRLGFDQYDEVHAYEVLEHLGSQGDVESFFFIFKKIYGVLKPNGYLCGTCPSRYSPWLWGDPGHTRVIIPESLTFLDQLSYEQCGITALSDYRYIWKGDFKVITSVDDRVKHTFILQAIKPARVAWKTKEQK